jgi:circadian clock protein KaiC
MEGDMNNPNMLARSPKKIATGILGIDEMTGGGLPQGRASVVMGSAGTGKTVFAMQTLAHWIEVTSGVGAFVSFEQPADSILADMASFHWKIPELVAGGRLLIIDGRPEPDAIRSGKFDILGLISAIGGSVDSDGLSCAVFDGIDAILTALNSPNDQRGELMRLQESILDRKISAILTLKESRAENATFEDLAVYASDCVIELKRVSEDEISSRSLQIKKYRSSGHTENWIPYIITANGIEVELTDPHPGRIPVSVERVSTGVQRLDVMLDGGFLRGSTTLLSGSPGTSKTTLGTLFLATACGRDERSLCILFDEAPEEIVRNVASVGTELAGFLDRKLLRMHGLVAHSAGPDAIANEILTQLRDFDPHHLMIDPVSAFSNSQASQNAIKRIIQYCKRKCITVILTSLIQGGAGELEVSQSHVSTLSDNWLHLSYIVNSGERNRALTIVKSRGTGHSNQVAELILSDSGISVADTYAEDGIVLMGTLRWQKEKANERARAELKDRDALEYRDKMNSVEEIAARIDDLNMELARKKEEMELLRTRIEESEHLQTDNRLELSKIRQGTASHPNDEAN